MKIKILVANDQGQGGYVWIDLKDEFYSTWERFKPMAQVVLDDLIYQLHFENPLPFNDMPTALTTED